VFEKKMASFPAKDDYFKDISKEIQLQFAIVDNYACNPVPAMLMPVAWYVTYITACLAGTLAYYGAYGDMMLLITALSITANVASMWLPVAIIENALPSRNTSSRSHARQQVDLHMHAAKVRINAVADKSA
jgi:hypothetical protein